MKSDVLSQEQQEFIHNRLLQRQAAIRAVVPWPNLHRGDLGAFLSFAWKKDETPWGVEGQAHWLTTQAANDFDFQKALESDGLCGIKMAPEALAELFSAFDSLTPSRAAPEPQRFLGENWAASAQLASQTFLSHFAEATTIISAYLVFARTGKGAQIRCVFANSAAHASRVSRSAWKKEGHRDIALFMTVAMKDAAQSIDRLEDVQRGHNPDLLWPKTTPEEYDRARDAFVASRCEQADDSPAKATEG